MANKRIVLKQWNWWISNDPNVWQAGSFAYGEWIEIRTNSKRFEMSKNSWSEVLLTTADNPVVSYIIEDNTHLLRFHSNWKISSFLKNQIDTTNYEMDLGETIYNAWVITTTAWVRWFILSASKIYKWTYNWTASDLWLSTITNQAYSFTNVSCPILYGQNTFYAWNWTTLVKVDTSVVPWVASVALTIDLDYTIKWITRIWDQIFIYASNWSSSRQYLWDWSSTTVLRQITWVDKPIMNVANFANYDYVFTWWTGTQSKTQMYRVDWYQLTLLYQNDINNNTSIERIFFNPARTNAIETIWTKLLIPWYWWIYTYWQFTPWMPTSLVKEYTHNFGKISALYYSENADYSFWYSWYWTVWGVNGTYEVQQSLTPENYSQKKPWYLITNPIFWDCLSNKKNTQRFAIWMKGTTNKNRINVYRKDVLWYATIMVPRWVWLVPWIWSIYSISWLNYTITNVLTTNNVIIMQCTCPVTATPWTWWTITKVSGTWETTYYTELIKYQKYITTISDFTNNRFIYNYPDNFNDISFAFELITDDASYTPSIYDFNLYYDETDDWN